LHEVRTLNFSWFTSATRIRSTQSGRKAANSTSRSSPWTHLLTGDCRQGGPRLYTLRSIPGIGQSILAEHLIASVKSYIWAATESKSAYQGCIRAKYGLLSWSWTGRRQRRGRPGRVV